MKGELMLQKRNPVASGRSGSAMLRRKCDCGGHAGSGGEECEECKKKKLQRRAKDAAGPAMAPPIVHEVLSSPGQPLDRETRAFFEPRIGHDFGQVRVHADQKAAESARSVNALAYTVGANLVFGAGQYAAGTPQGRKLLAHELTHAVQQGFQNSAPERLEVGPAGDQLELEAGAAAEGLRPLSSGDHRPVLQRQGTTAAAPPSPTPGFSVNQGAYLTLVGQAVQQMQGRLVDAQTLAPTIKPMLDALLAKVTWVDGTGKQQGGASVQQQFPGTPPTSVSLRLVLDDTVSGDKFGDFEPAGTKSGIIRIFIKKNTNVDSLTETLYHEALHTMTWLANRPNPPDLAQKNNPQTTALTRARHAPEVQLVQNVLDNLASNINPQRKAKGQALITPAGLDSAASFLVEEAEVRAETVVFEHYLGMQQGMVIGKPTVATPGQRPQSVDVNTKMVDAYVFDFSGVFKPGDRAFLLPGDQQSMAALSQILENFYNRQIQRRTAAPGVRRPVPREQVNIPLSPLNP